jgi:hypothetical protein
VCTQILGAEKQNTTTTYAFFTSGLCAMQALSLYYRTDESHEDINASCRNAKPRFRPERGDGSGSKNDGRTDVGD